MKLCFFWNERNRQFQWLVYLETFFFENLKVIYSSIRFQESVWNLFLWLLFFAPNSKIWLLVIYYALSEIDFLTLQRKIEIKDIISLSQVLKRRGWQEYQLLLSLSIFCVIFGNSHCLYLKLGSALQKALHMFLGRIAIGMV